MAVHGNREVGPGEASNEQLAVWLNDLAVAVEEEMLVTRTHMHIPAAGPADQPATGSQRIHLGMPRRALNSSLQVTVSRPQAEQCPSIEHRIAPRPQGDRISNRRRTVSSSLIV